MFDSLKGAHFVNRDPVLKKKRSQVIDKANET